jgi:hypothetical protein
MNKDVLDKMSMQEVLGYIDTLEETTKTLINENNSVYRELQQIKVNYDKLVLRENKDYITIQNLKEELANKQKDSNNYVVITDVPDTLETFTMDEAIRFSQDILLTGTEKQVCIAKVFGLYEIDKPATFKLKVIE